MARTSTVRFVQVSVPLDCPLPARDWYQTPSGGWASRLWTKESYARAKSDACKTVSRPA